MKTTISGIILSYNASSMIEDCLESLSFCDEIIVVDSGSSDKTKEKAEKFGAKIIDGNQGNFAENRNLGLQHAKGEWALYIDTDERIDKQLRESIQNASDQSGCSAYTVQRKNFYLGKHEWPKTELLERFFQKKYLKGWHGKLHETATIEGKVGKLDGYLLHFTHKSLEEMLDKTIDWSKIEAQLRIDAHHPPVVWWRFFRVMFTGFFNSFIRQQGWKAGTAGLVESIYQAYSMFVTYARLWEMQQRV